MMFVDHLRDLFDAIRASSRQQRLLRLAVVLGPVIACLAASAVVRHVLVPVLVLVVVLALCCALQTDSNLGLLVVVVLAWHWAGVVHSPRTPWLLVAALGLLLFHAGMSLSSTGPTTASWSSSDLRRWVRRTTVVGAITLGTWLLTIAIHAIDVDGGVVVLVLSGVLLAAGALVLRARSMSPA